MTQFKLTEAQESKLSEWRRDIKKVFGKYGDYDFIFNPGAIGDIVKVYSHLSKTYLDLTEFENW